MALLVMIIRKMTQNKWLVSSLFAGLVISVALVSSLPIYTEAVLSRMLVKDLETMQIDTNQYPGSQYNKLVFGKASSETVNQIFNNVNGYMKNEASAGFQIPVQSLVTDIQSKPMKIRPSNDPAPDSNKSLKTMSLRSFTDLEQHIKLIDGRMPAEQQPVNGVYEVIVTERALMQFKGVVGSQFIVDDDTIADGIKLKLVGVFEKKDDTDPYFRDADLSDLRNNFIISEQTATRAIFQEGRIPAAYAGWFFVLDYSKFELRFIDDYIQTTNEIREVLMNNGSIYQVLIETPALETISQYLKRADDLQTLMWSLYVPVLIMLGFYMFMIANLIAERQKNEIAVIRSRGAARWQIIASYGVEGMILCAIACGVGPLIGAILTEVLGASNGFLEFVQRVRLPVRISADAYRYGAIASGICLIIMIIPVMIATKVTIVGHKQQLARLLKLPLWHKMFLDIITLSLALYGLYTFKKKLADLQGLGLAATDLAIDPLQFIMPALFVMGGGLLILRLYPWILKLVYWTGRKWWPPSAYATLIQVSRSSSQYQFLMIFLIMTIATGVFSASAARTINSNTEDRIRYGNGAEIVLSSLWRNDAPPPPLPGPGQKGSTAPATPVHYLEPAYEPYLQLPGVEYAAKVFKKEVSFGVNEGNGTATLIGIDTDDFGETTWFRDNLLDYHINDYLNLIAGDSQAVLISRTLANQKKVKPGDTIWIGWSDVPQQPFKVYAIIDYFPTFNPNPGSGNEENQKKAESPMLIVGHLPRIQLQLAMAPYDVWIKLKPEATLTDFYAGLKESGLPITKIVSTREEVIQAKNDPYLMALNGILTLGFVLSILVSFIGFLLYWVLSLRGRALQNGILRAIGLTLKQLIGMLAIEQLLTSGIAVVIGILIGNTASRLYVPNFQMTFNQSMLVPPFQVMFEYSDFIRIYIIVGIMLLIGLGILAYMLSRLRIHQAIKLGED